MLPATRYFGIFALVIKTTQSGKSEDSPNLWPVSQILVMNENGDCCSSSLHFLLWEKLEGREGGMTGLTPVEKREREGKEEACCEGNLEHRGEERE